MNGLPEGFFELILAFSRFHFFRHHQQEFVEFDCSIAVDVNLVNHVAQFVLCLNHKKGYLASIRLTAFYLHTAWTLPQRSHNNSEFGHCNSSILVFVEKHKRLLKFWKNETNKMLLTMHQTSHESKVRIRLL